jgi:hypothetical protein
VHSYSHRNGQPSLDTINLSLPTVVVICCYSRIGVLKQLPIVIIGHINSFIDFKDLVNLFLTEMKPACKFQHGIKIDITPLITNELVDPAKIIMSMSRLSIHMHSLVMSGDIYRRDLICAPLVAVIKNGLKKLTISRLELNWLQTVPAASLSSLSSLSLTANFNERTLETVRRLTSLQHLKLHWQPEYPRQSGMLSVPHVSYFPRSLTSVNLGYVAPEALELVVTDFGGALKHIEASIWNTGLVQWSTAQLRALYQLIVELNLTSMGDQLLQALLGEEYDDQNRVDRRDNNAADTKKTFHFTLPSITRIDNMSCPEYLVALLRKAPKLTSLQMVDDRNRQYDTGIIEWITKLSGHGTSLTEVDISMKNGALNPNIIIAALAPLNHSLVALTCNAIIAPHCETNIPERKLLQLGQLEVFTKLSKLVLHSDTRVCELIEWRDVWLKLFWPQLSMITLRGDYPVLWGAIIAAWRAEHLDIRPPTELYEFPRFIRDDAADWNYSSQSLSIDHWSAHFPSSCILAYHRNSSNSTINSTNAIHMPYQLAFAASHAR